MLDDALAEAGVSRDEVFITNLVRCRPPGNRRPRKDEKGACRGFLVKEIEETGVEVICALGETVARELIGVDERMSDLVGRAFPIHLFGKDYTAVVAYHPAACLYRRDKLPSFRNSVRCGLEAAGML